MGHSDLDPAVHERRPWNAGQNVGPKRPLMPRDVWAIRFYLDEHKRMRDRALFDIVNRRSIGTPYRRAKGTPLRCVDRLMLGAGFALLAA